LTENLNSNGEEYIRQRCSWMQTGFGWYRDY
jgi:hypothetical protein